MRFDELDDLNIALFAAKFYENPEVSSIDEFHEDLNDKVHQETIS